MPSINEAHPRVSGENPIGSPAPGDLAGSSPRERGKLRLHMACPFWLRLIPA